MDEDAHGVLGATEYAGDLRGAHLVDEAQDDRPASVRRQAPDRGPCGGDVLARRGAALDVERIGNDRGGVERGRRMAAARAPVVRDDVAGDAEQPDAERRGALAVGRPGPLLESAEVGQREEERPLGGVLGVVVVAELVVRVGIHLGEIPAIEGFEGSGVVARGLDECTIPIEVRDGGADSSAPGLLLGAHPSEHRPRHSVTPCPVARRGARAGSRR